MNKFAFSLFTLVMLSACSGDVKGELGLRRQGPDEFAVEKRPKLEVPPQFKLRPPNPGEQPLNVEDPKDLARKSLIDAPIVTGAKSESEENLLGKLGAEKANPNIRDVIKTEYDERQDPSVLDKIRQISDDNIEKTVVDAKKEKERIEENKKKNKPITEGETPAKSINDGKPILDKIFN